MHNTYANFKTHPNGYLIFYVYKKYVFNFNCQFYQCIKWNFIVSLNSDLYCESWLYKYQ